MSKYMERVKKLNEARAKHAKKPEHDKIDHPSHYAHGGVECIDALRSALTAAQFEGFLQGNVFKYVFRANFKGHKREDLEKAHWYLTELIDYVEPEEEEEEEEDEEDE